MAVSAGLAEGIAVASTVSAGMTGGSVAAGVSKAVHYTGPMDVARQVIKSEGGVLGLFKGLTPTLLREVPGNACLFGAYEGTKQVRVTPYAKRRVVLCHMTPVFGL